MAAKIVKFSVVDGSGAGVPGQKLDIGGMEYLTSVNGMAQALLEDGNTMIKVNGAKAYEGPVAGLQPTEVFTVAGERRA